MWSHAWKCSLQCICPLGTCSESHCIAHLTSSILSIFLFAWEKLNRLKADLIDRECAYLWLAGWQADSRMAQSNHSIAGCRRVKEKYAEGPENNKNKCLNYLMKPKRTEMPWMMKGKQFEKPDGLKTFTYSGWKRPIWSVFKENDKFQKLNLTNQLFCYYWTTGSVWVLKLDIKFFLHLNLLKFASWLPINGVSSHNYWLCS